MHEVRRLFPREPDVAVTSVTEEQLKRWLHEERARLQQTKDHVV